jgi:hypothetical protein
MLFTVKAVYGFFRTLPNIMEKMWQIQLFFANVGELPNILGGSFPKYEV